MKINMQSNLKDVASRLGAMGSRIPTVNAIALTRSAKDGQRAIADEMSKVFDRPTPYALNGTFLKAATRSNLESRVWVKDNPFGKGTPADRFLLPQIYGGSRSLKGMERILQSAGLMPAGQFAVPGAGAQLDSYGNVKRSQITQMLSQLQVQRGAGHESRRSDSARSRLAVARQGVTYFALPKPVNGLRPGIYLKKKFSGGTSIKPVFIFVGKVTYRPRLRFHEVGVAAAEKAFPRHISAELRRMIADARLR